MFAGNLDKNVFQVVQDDADNVILIVVIVDLVRLTATIWIQRIVFMVVYRIILPLLTVNDDNILLYTTKIALY